LIRLFFIALEVPLTLYLIAQEWILPGLLTDPWVIRSACPAVLAVSPGGQPTIGCSHSGLHYPGGVR
jgi:hypothetical protein